MSSERELKDLKLPSGEAARVVTYFNRGEIRAIKKARWQGTEISVDETEKIKANKLDPLSDDYIDDEIVFQGIKFLEGKPITRELLDGLRGEDFDVCLRRLKPLFLGKKKR